MDLLACGETEQKPSQTFIYSVFQLLKIESYSIPGILLKTWEYICEQN